MRAKTVASKALLVAAVAGASGVFAETVHAGSAASRAKPCASVKARATPATNTAMIPETIKSKVTSCAAGTETVTLVQTITSDTTSPTTKKWTITLSPGKTVVKTRSLAYACCGSYTVTDKVYSQSHAQLGKATASFTFA